MPAKKKISLNTSADDLKSSLQCGEAQSPPTYSPDEIAEALKAAEDAGMKTHAKHLRTALNRARKRDASDLVDDLGAIVGGGSVKEAIAAMQAAPLDLLRQLAAEYDIDGIAESHDTDEGRNLAVTLGAIIAEKSGEVASPVTPKQAKAGAPPAPSAEASAKEDTSQSQPGEATIPTRDLFFDEGLQMREGFDQDHLEAMVEHLRQGGTLPAIDVYEFCDDDIGANGEHYYIGDGNHRGMAYRQAKIEHVPVILHPGGRDAALRRALGANAEHNALRRTNRDKRKAVLSALREFPDLSDNKIAGICKVTQPFVSKLRKGEGYNGYNPDSEEGGKNSKQKQPEQLFMSLFFEKKKGWMPGLRRVLDHPELATVSRSYWGDLAADLREMLKTVETRAGLDANPKQ
ncbi:MAG: hypothetical protein ACQKBU_12425 [Verrucomicrobiales bacterium]